MYTVHEVSKLTGVSIRTLHHYDAIGLLHPAEVTEAGYRLYGDGQLARLQSILLFRELRFSLSEIKAMLDSPQYDMRKALCQQIELLEKERAHINQLIDCARSIQEKGVTAFMFDALDRTEMEAYKKEAYEKWGETAAWQEYASRKVTPDQHQQAAKDMMVLFGEMGEVKHLPPESDEAQAKVKALQQFITDNFYTCTKEILKNLGLMYTQHDRFRQSIDSVGGEGTAAFVQKAIEIYCK